MHTEAHLLSEEERPRYFVVDSRGDKSVREWFPPEWNASWPADCRYYGKVFRHMERFLTVPKLHFYITWDTNWLPEYGPDVVAILLGDEWAQRPRYARYVNTVVRTFESRPVLGIRRWFPFDALRRNLVVKHARNLIVHYRASWREVNARFSVPPVLRRGHILQTPLGTSMLDDLPIKPVSNRPYHCFFAGQFVEHPAHGLASLKESPKQIARREMVKAMIALRERDPRLRLDLTILATSNYRQDTSDSRSYSERMMDSKICLAPRGTVVDTWRFFEGLKSGCLVICEPLPDEYYYRDAPVIQIDSWRQLEQVIAPFIDDEAELEKWSARSLDYWQNVCGEEAVGHRIADFIALSPACRRSVEPMRKKF
jgi:hypothetical protein